MFQQNPNLAFGEETILTHSLEILLLLGGAFLLGVWLGWAIWSRFRKMVDDLEESRDRQAAAYSNLQKDHASLRYRFDELSKDSEILRADLERAEADRIVLEQRIEELETENRDIVAAGAAVLAAETVTTEAIGTATVGVPSIAAVESPTAISYDGAALPENLQIIEGITPQIESILHENGIENWKKLGSTSDKGLAKILKGAGLDPTIVNPISWAAQARLAQAGSWDKLTELQRKLANPDEESETVVAPKIERYFREHTGFGAADPTDLQIIEGIGAKMSGLLRGAGIRSWNDLAASTPQQLQGILDNAGSSSRLARPGTWSRQAQLALAGRWVELRRYQEELQRG